MYIISRCIDVYEESRTSVKQSFLIAIKFWAMPQIRIRLYSNSWIISNKYVLLHKIKRQSSRSLPMMQFGRVLYSEPAWTFSNLFKPFLSGWGPCGKVCPVWRPVQWGLSYLLMGWGEAGPCTMRSVQSVGLSCLRVRPWFSGICGYVCRWSPVQWGLSCLSGWTLNSGSYPVWGWSLVQWGLSCLGVEPWTVRSGLSGERGHCTGPPPVDRQTWLKTSPSCILQIRAVISLKHRAITKIQ